MLIHYHHGSRQVGKILTPYILSHRKGRQRKRLWHLTCDLESSRSTPIVIAPSIRPQLLQQDYTSSRKTTPPPTRCHFLQKDHTSFNKARLPNQHIYYIALSRQVEVMPTRSWHYCMQTEKEVGFIVYSWIKRQV